MSVEILLHVLFCNHFKPIYLFLAGGHKPCGVLRLRSSGVQVVHCTISQVVHCTISDAIHKIVIVDVYIYYVNFAANGS